MNDAALLDFVYAEAELLDAGRFDDWLGLFADDGCYWVPLQGSAQSDPRQHNSIAYEDRLLLQLRVERLKNPRAHSQHPRSTCQHVLQAPRVIHRDPQQGLYRLRTPFIYCELRGSRELTLAGQYLHTLTKGPEGLRIRQKRVDLAGAGRPLPMIQLFP